MRRLLAIVVAASVILAVVGVLVLVRIFRVPAVTMVPTVQPGDRIAVIRFHGPVEPNRGDIVVFESTPSFETRCGARGTFVQRIVGLPGETVVQRRGRVFVNGRALREPYMTPGRRGAISGSWYVPGGTYFLLGDNRIESCDSRVFGAVPDENLIGEVFATYWPPGRFTFR